MDSFGKMLLNVGIGAAIVIIAFAIFQLLKPQVQPQQVIQMVNQSKDLVVATVVK